MDEFPNGRGDPFSLGEKVAVEPEARLRRDGRMRGPYFAQRRKAPPQFGQMTYDRAVEDVHVDSREDAAVSHDLTSSPPRGEAMLSERL